MEINYNFIPQYKSEEIKHKSDIISYAGKLLEITNAYTLIVGLDNENKPFVLDCNGGRLNDTMDFFLETY